MLTPKDEKFQKEYNTEKEEHLETLRLAEEALTEAEKNIREGKDRLENAIKKYKERSKVYGPSKPI